MSTVMAHAAEALKLIPAMSVVVTVLLALRLKIAMARLEDQPCTILATCVTETAQPVLMDRTAPTELSVVTAFVTAVLYGMAVTFAVGTVPVVVSMMSIVKAPAVAAPSLILVVFVVGTVPHAQLAKTAMAKLEDQPCTTLVTFVTETVRRVRMARIVPTAL